jgi:hypothetical protein
MTRERREGEIEIAVETESADLPLVSVAQFLSGVAIMREAVGFVSGTGQSRFRSRLAVMRSPLLWAPELVLESCGRTWAILRDWPPMESMFRGGMTQGLLDACDPARGPKLESVNAGSLTVVLRELVGDIRGNVSRGLSALKFLVGRADRGTFTDEMLSVLGVSRPPESGMGGLASIGMALLPPIGTAAPGMTAAGMMMFACQAIEGSLSSLEAKGIEVLAGGSERPQRSPRRSKRASRGKPPSGGISYR